MPLPKLSLAAWWVKPAIYAALIALAVFSLKSFGRDVKEFFFGNPEVTRARAETVVQEELNEGLTQASARGMEVVVRVEREKANIDTTTRRNENAIKQATGADTPLPGVAAALHDSLCLRAVYQGELDCAAVQGAPGGERPAEPDAGGD
jgi:hypothetical protein